MDLLVLDHDDVEKLLTIEVCLPVMEEALASLARGEVHQPLRIIVAPEGAPGLLGLMPAYIGGVSPALGVKVTGVFPGNRELGLDSHQGAVVLLDAANGVLRAVMDTSAVTGIRTAAVSALATRLLAREDAGDLALVGVGVQAAYHLTAMAAVRKLRRVRVAGRSLGSARAFAAEHGGRSPVPVEAVGSVEEAVRGADIIVVGTTAKSPAVLGSWLSPGAHLNVIGGPGVREVDNEAMARSAVFADHRVALEGECREWNEGLADGAFAPDHLRGELGEVVAGLVPGRTSPDEITLFKSLGIAVEDVASAAWLYARAVEGGVGTWVRT